MRLDVPEHRRIGRRVRIDEHRIRVERRADEPVRARLEEARLQAKSVLVCDDRGAEVALLFESIGELEVRLGIFGRDSNGGTERRDRRFDDARRACETGLNQLWHSMP